MAEEFLAADLLAGDFTNGLLKSQHVSILAVEQRAIEIE
jgi:hypothetical protein